MGCDGQEGTLTLTLLFSCIQRCCRVQAYGIFEQRGGNNRRAMDLYNMAIRVDERHSAAWLAKAQVYIYTKFPFLLKEEKMCAKIDFTYTDRRCGFVGRRQCQLDVVQ
jgi:hypothetical protein